MAQCSHEKCEKLSSGQAVILQTYPPQLIHVLGGGQVLNPDTDIGSFVLIILTRKTNSSSHVGFSV